jgi:hypothetical protein
MRRQLILDDSNYSNLMLICTNINADITNFNGNKTMSLNPMLMGVVTSIVYIYAFFIPWILWSSYRFHTLWLYIFFVWPFLALLSAGRELGDPYIPYNESFFTFNDLQLKAFHNQETIINSANSILMY